MNAKLEIINTMTEPAAWLERVQEQMGLGNEILLLLSQIDEPKSKALSKLCHAYHYSQDADMDHALSDQCRKMLDMHDYAAKEHGIGIEMVFLLHPTVHALNQPQPQPRLV